MNDNLPIINLELNSGDFRIKTQEAIYHISVRPDSSLTPVMEKVVAREAANAEAPASVYPAEDLFFREISEEMYSEIGKMARKLALSIKDIPTKYRSVNLEQTGIELENAKGQLENIIQMTEKATMDIMDLAESIQEDLEKAVTHLKSIQGLEFMMKGEDAQDWDSSNGSAFEAESADNPPIQAGQFDASTQFIGSLQAYIDQLRSLVSGLPQLESSGSAAETHTQPAPESPKVKVYQFDPDVIWQTLYELCTNETVKDHIKAMRADQKTAFNADAVEKALAEMAPSVDAEDNFFNFPLAVVLKFLFQATTNEKYKQILKKINQTAASIFLDAILPLEGRVEEVETTPQPGASAPEKQAPASAAKPGLPGEKIEHLHRIIDEGAGLIEKEKQRLENIEQAAVPSPALVLDADHTRVKKEDREKIITAIEDSSEVVQRVMTNINGILEALSFQDLSGQRILKIVQMISEVQVQLLSLLISFGARIKQKKGDTPAGLTTKEDAARLAQNEVDKMLESISSPPSELEGPDAQGRLDQDSVNRLLGDLGF